MKNKICLLTTTTSYPVTTNSISGVFIKRFIEHFPDYINTTIITAAGTTQYKNTTNSEVELIQFRYAPLKYQVLAHQPGGLPASIKKNDYNLLLLFPFTISFFISIVFNSRKVDLIHAHWSLAGVISCIAGKITRTEVITTLHGSDIAKAKSSRAYWMLLYICLKLSHRIITVSTSLEQELLSLFPKFYSKIKTISNGVEKSLLDINMNVSSSKMIKLIYIGSLIPLKGVKIILNAVAEYRGKNSIQLTIIGDGPEKESLQQLTNYLQIESQVNFTGSVPASDIATELSNADILILASSREGRPSVLLEAMAAGVPVIASNIEAVNNLITHGKNGLLFDLDIESSLTLELEKLANNHKLRALFSTEGRKFIRSKKLLWSETVKNYYKEYNSILNAKK